MHIVLSLANEYKHQKNKTLNYFTDEVLAPGGRALQLFSRQYVYSLQNDIRMLDGPLTFRKLQRLPAYRSLIYNITNGITHLGESILHRFGSTFAEYMAVKGANHATRLAIAQLVKTDIPQDKFTSMVAAAEFDTRQSLDIDNYVRKYTESGEFRTKLSRLGLMILPKFASEVENKLIYRQKVNRELTAQHIYTLASEAVGTGIAWMGNMFVLALNDLYNYGSLSFMRNNSDWINGWIWYSTLDHKTCGACLFLHGKVFPLDFEMTDHPQGRCIPIPQVSALPTQHGTVVLYPSGGDHSVDTSWRDQIIMGEDWFIDTLTEEEQEDLLGSALYNAWRKRKIRLSDIPIQVEHPIYGRFTRRAYLNELLSKKR